MFLLTFPRVTVVWDNFRVSSLSVQTTTASCPPNINMSSRKVEKAKHDATNGRAELRLPTGKDRNEVLKKMGFDSYSN